jgi:uncharacterized protein YydD (DUF2326 family)
MQLEHLTIRRGATVVRTITFKKGLNLILDKPTSQKTQSGNNLGKTTVLRLIDFCLGSDGDDIWQDSEFKRSINRDVYDFLHGATPVTVELALESGKSDGHLFVRSFNAKKSDPNAFRTNKDSHKNVTEYRAAVRSILFNAGGTKPTLRQLCPKFVRSSPQIMGKTLKFLGDYGSEADYEALHLFLFGFFAVDVLEERPRLQTQRKKLERDLQALTRMRDEGEIEQLLLHLQSEVQDLSLSSQARGEVPEIATHADRVSEIRSCAASIAASLGRVEAEVNAIHLAVEELQSEYADIDRQTIERIYKEAQRYIPKLQHDWNELTVFIQNLRGRKERFLQAQASDLEEKATALRIELETLQAQEKTEIGVLMKSRAFNQALEVRADLQDRLKRLGSLEQDIADIRELKTQIGTVANRLAATKEQIEMGKAKLRENVAIFNRYFSKLSKELYGEEYLLHFDETERGSVAFRLSSVGSNVGSGKKMSQTAAFDLAYVDFLRATRTPFPTFVCHDGLESIHGNQLAALLQIAATLNGQLIVATLRDKLPAMQKTFISDNTVLELSQDDKLFGL